MKTITLSSHFEDAAAAAVEFLIEGGVVLLPTDTSYGLAAAADNEAAVQRVFELKGRQAGQPLSVVVPSREAGEQLAQFSPEAARLWTAFMPGPLTLVLPPASDTGLVARVTNNGQSVALRHPKHELDVLIAERLGKPYTATSANRSGQPPAFTVDEFLESLPDGLVPHLVIDAGTLPIVPVSTVVSVIDAVTVLREAAIPATAVQEIAQLSQ